MLWTAVPGTTEWPNWLKIPPLLLLMSVWLIVTDVDDRSMRPPGRNPLSLSVSHSYPRVPVGIV